MATLGLPPPTAAPDPLRRFIAHHRLALYLPPSLPSDVCNEKTDDLERDARNGELGSYANVLDKVHVDDKRHAVVSLK